MGLWPGLCSAGGRLARRHSPAQGLTKRALPVPVPEVRRPGSEAVGQRLSEEPQGEAPFLPPFLRREQRQAATTCGAGFYLPTRG